MRSMYHSPASIWPVIAANVLHHYPLRLLPVAWNMRLKISLMFKLLAEAVATFASFCLNGPAVACLTPLGRLNMI